MWNRGLLLLSSPAWAARIDSSAVRLSALDGDLDLPQVLDNSSNLTLIADNDTLLAASGEADNNAKANLTATGNLMHSRSDSTGNSTWSDGGMNLAVVRANVSENGTIDNQTNKDSATWLARSMNPAVVSVAQISSEFSFAVNAAHTAVSLTPAELRSNAVATLGINGGPCGAWDNGGYVGCNLGCSCGWGRSCARSVSVVSGGEVDVGVCRASTRTLVAVPLLLLASCVAAALALRSLLAKREVELQPAALSAKKDSLTRRTMPSTLSTCSIHTFEPSLSDSSDTSFSLGSDSGSDYDINEGLSSGVEPDEHSAQPVQASTAAMDHKMHTFCTCPASPALQQQPDEALARPAQASAAVTA